MIFFVMDFLAISVTLLYKILAIANSHKEKSRLPSTKS